MLIPAEDGASVPATTLRPPPAAPTIVEQPRRATDHIPRHQSSDNFLGVLAVPCTGVPHRLRNQQKLLTSRSLLEHSAYNLQCTLLSVCPSQWSRDLTTGPFSCI